MAKTENGLESCPACGADLGLPGAVRVRFQGPISGSGDYASGTLRCVLDATPGSQLQVLAWCRRCKKVLLDVESAQVSGLSE